MMKMMYFYEHYQTEGGRRPCSKTNYKSMKTNWPCIRGLLFSFPPYMWYSEFSLLCRRQYGHTYPVLCLRHRPKICWVAVYQRCIIQSNLFGSWLSALGQVGTCWLPAYYEDGCSSMAPSSISSSLTCGYNQQQSSSPEVKHPASSTAMPIT